MSDRTKAEELLRRTFRLTTPMQPEERINQAPRPWTTEELNAAGIPENLHAQATWWSTLEEMKEDLNL
ncbi:hypothetical protein A6K26_006555 [Gammaproteobacteria bacterium 2W06]|nr:hypothetical protein A6K26_006555 [Gammaproteobacteria bacterium 2W06]